MRSLAKSYGVWIVCAAVLLLLPALFPGGKTNAAVSLLSLIAIAVVFSLAYNMLLGQGGMLSFGHAVYFGLAGYFVAHYLNGVQEDELIYIPLSLVPIIGALVGLFFGIVIGAFSTRRAGTTFAMISLGIIEMVTALVLILIAFFNGEEGIQTDRAIGTELFGLVGWSTDIETYYLVAVWTFLAMIAMYALTRTPFGRMSNAVRDNPERAQFVGYNTQRVRWLAFSLSGFFAGLAGALNAIATEQVGFDAVGLERSAFVLFMVFIGGAGHFAGPIIGAVLITFLEHVLSDWTGAWRFYLGGIFMVIVMFSPGGIAGVLQLHERLWKVDLALVRRLVTPYAKAIGASLTAFVGASGIVECAYRLTSNPDPGTNVRIMAVPFDAATAWPWLVSAMFLVGGVFLCRRTYPGAKNAYGEAFLAATERMTR